MIDIKNVPGKGTAQADALVRQVQRIINSSINGIALHGRAYPGTNTTDAEVIGYLANPKRGPKRDVRVNDEEAHESGKLYVAEIARRVRQTQGRSGKKVTGGAEADAIQAGALRIAGKFIQSKYAKRIESQTLRDGSSAANVSEPYATRREKKYGVPKSVVFKATGQLLTSVFGGVLKLNRK